MNKYNPWKSDINSLWIHYASHTGLNRLLKIKDNCPVCEIFLKRRFPIKK